MIIPSQPLIDELVRSFNSKELTMLSSTFKENAAIYEHPSVVVIEGKKDLTIKLGELFEKFPISQMEILYRMINSEHVIDMTQLVLHPEEPPIDIVIIYQIHDRIERVDIVK